MKVIPFFKFYIMETNGKFCSVRECKSKFNASNSYELSNNTCTKVKANNISELETAIKDFD